MEWVKLTTDYYRDLAIATSDDVVEVMFTRGCALAGEVESSGFIPEAMLHTLTRRPQHARRTANTLVAKDLWEKVPGGWQIVNWAEIQAELERLVAKKRRDRERKRQARAASTDVSAPASADVSAPASVDSPAPCPADSLLDHQSEELDTAAAASCDDLPDELVILRARLDAANLRVRWDKLDAAKTARAVELQQALGDSLMVEIAKRSWRADSPPMFAQAWIGNWEAHLQAVTSGSAINAAPCVTPGHSGTTTHCAQCASEAKAAR